MVGFDINFSAGPNDPLLGHPTYQKWAAVPFSSVDVTAVKDDLKAAYADAASAPVVAYLSWLLRVKALLV